MTSNAANEDKGPEPQVELRMDLAPQTELPPLPPPLPSPPLQQQLASAPVPTAAAVAPGLQPADVINYEGIALHSAPAAGGSSRADSGCGPVAGQHESSLENLRMTFQTAEQCYGRQPSASVTCEAHKVRRKVRTPTFQDIFLYLLFGAQQQHGSWWVATASSCHEQGSAYGFNNLCCSRLVVLLIHTLEALSFKRKPEP